MAYGDRAIAKELAAQLGIEWSTNGNDAEPGDYLTWDEVVQANRGTPRPEGFYKPGLPREKAAWQGNVGFKVRGQKRPHPKSDTDTYWEEAVKLFPYPEGVPPRTYSQGLYSERSSSAAVVDRLSNTWLNPFNAQFKRRCLYSNYASRLSKMPGPFYVLGVPLDDWSPHVHEALTTRINRAGAKTGEPFGWLWVDNFLVSGVMVYLTNVPMPDFDIIDDYKGWLATALAAISPPGPNQSGRFRPCDSSWRWKAKAGVPGEESTGQWEVIATTMNPTQWSRVKTQCLKEGLEYQIAPKFWPRSQWGNGLEIKVRSRDEALRFFGFLGYQLRLQRARAGGGHGGKPDGRKVTD